MKLLVGVLVSVVLPWYVFHPYTVDTNLTHGYFVQPPPPKPIIPKLNDLLKVR